MREKTAEDILRFLSFLTMKVAVPLTALTLVGSTGNEMGW